MHGTGGKHGEGVAVDDEEGGRSDGEGGEIWLMAREEASRLWRASLGSPSQISVRNSTHFPSLVTVCCSIFASSGLRSLNPPDKSRGFALGKRAAELPSRLPNARSSRCPSRVGSLSPTAHPPPSTRGCPRRRAGGRSPAWPLAKRCPVGATPLPSSAAWDEPIGFRSTSPLAGVRSGGRRPSGVLPHLEPGGRHRCGQQGRSALVTGQGSSHDFISSSFLVRLRPRVWHAPTRTASPQTSAIFARLSSLSPSPCGNRSKPAPPRLLPILVAGLPSRLIFCPDMQITFLVNRQPNGVIPIRSACLLSISIGGRLYITLLTWRVNGARTPPAPCRGTPMYSISPYHPSASSAQTPQSSFKRGSRARCVSLFVPGLSFSIYIRVLHRGAARSPQTSLVARTHFRHSQQVYTGEMSIEQLKLRTSRWSLR